MSTNAFTEMSLREMMAVVLNVTEAKAATIVDRANDLCSRLSCATCHLRGGTSTRGGTRKGGETTTGWNCTHPVGIIG